ncbi:MAG: hypothetical protein K0R15_1015 [Clostridiales bacterium]|jgi:hypothetical protein|nr:hypothetical protein [Clostridiales bacterium]
MLDNIMYFESPGKTNTMEALLIAKNYLIKYNVRKIIIASTTGATALLAADILHESAVDIIVVGLDSYGWSQDEEKRQELIKLGIKTLPCNRYLNVEVANALRCFSQGIKVAFEIALMANYENLILENEEVLVVAGSGLGSDTVLLLKCINKNNITEFVVSKILCLPSC